MPRKTKIVISDTHIGAGGEPEGNKLEDFISDADFVDWLHELAAESNRDGIEMELIINGDWLEFPQMPDVARFAPHQLYPRSAYEDPAVAATLQRLAVVHEWHPSIFFGLADFLNPAAPRRSLTVLFGNHDPELAYPEVETRLRELLNATGDADLVRVGARSYFEDGVYIEHGNEYAESINRFSNPDAPFEANNPAKAERPPGTKIIPYFFNEVEWQRPWVDSVHPLTSLIFYALAYEPLFALRLLKAFLLAAPNVFLGLAATPAPGQPLSPSADLLDQIKTDDQQAELAQRLSDDPIFCQAFTVEVAQALMEKGCAPLPAAGLAGAPVGSDPIQRAREISEQIWQQLEDAAERIATEQGARVVLFGHIHERIEKQLPSGATYLNTGTWIGKVDLTNASDKVWQDLAENPDKYVRARNLTYARIDFDTAGQMTSARLERVGEAPPPPAPPGDLPDPGLFARLVLSIRNLISKLFGQKAANA